jgi:glycerate kinase
VSDGGEGFLDAFDAVGSRQVVRVAGPLGQEVAAEWLLGRDPDHPASIVAVVESALVIGVALVGGAAGNDPVRASSEGLGQVVAAAARAGARQVLVGLGGSATTDGGLGAVGVLAPAGRIPTVELVVACDVDTRFVDAAAQFAPQKGAGPREVELLQRRLERLAQLYEERYGVDVRDLRGSGSAGGLAGGLAAIGANLVPGFDLVAERLALAERIAGADLVVTGEGHLDRQSFSGKVVGGVARLARAAGVPRLVIAGGADADVQDRCVSLLERYGPERAMCEPAGCISEVVAAWLAREPRG